MKYDVVVAGSGISGMSMAFYCARENLKVLVIEKKSTAGGCFATEFTADFWLEMGAHTMYNSYSNLIDIIEGTGIAGDIIPRKKVPYKVFKKDKIRSVISQFSILELLFSIPSLFTLKKDGRTVESYYSRIVGKRNYRKFFQFMFNAVPSQPTNDFPADILFKKRQRRKDILRSFTFKNGVKSIIEAVEKYDGVDIIKGNGIRKLEKNNGHFNLTLEDGKVIKTEFLALATPVEVSADLLSDVHPILAKTLGRINHVHTDSMGVVIKKEDLDLKEVAGIIGIETDFYSVVSRDVVEDTRYRGFVFHFRPGELSDDEKIDFICGILSVSRESLVHIFQQRNPVPSFKLGHPSITNDIDNQLQDQHLFITGNYFSGMAIEDCVIRSLQEFRRLMDLKHKTDALQNE